MSKIALILAGVVAVVGFWVWSQKGQVKKTVVEKAPAMSGEYVRIKTVLDRDAGKMRFIIEPVGAPSISLSAFSMEVVMSKKGGKPVLNQGLIGVGWSFPISKVENQTLKLSGIYISPTAYVLSGEQEVAVVPIENLGKEVVQVSFGQENTKFLKKAATVVGCNDE